MTGTARSTPLTRDTSNGHSGSSSNSITPGTTRRQTVAATLGELPVPIDIIKAGDRAREEYVNSKRLAYYDDAQIWYCPSCRIVCANEEVLNDGTHEKCGNRVSKRNLKQWMLRIPYYAERLLSGLETLDWPEGIKEMQRNWIGRSTGAEVDFRVDGHKEKICVYTTRPDTLFGATYMVLAPEHPLVEKITAPEQRKAVEEYIKCGINEVRP